MNNTCNCNENLATPAVYMAERPEGYDITFEIPGAGKNDVDLHVDGRTLRLRTTKKPAEKPAPVKVQRATEGPVKRRTPVSTKKLASGASSAPNAEGVPAPAADTQPADTTIE